MLSEFTNSLNTKNAALVQQGRNSVYRHYSIGASVTQAKRPAWTKSLMEVQYRHHQNLEGTVPRKWKLSTAVYPGKNMAIFTCIIACNYNEFVQKPLRIVHPNRDGIHPSTGISTYSSRYSSRYSRTLFLLYFVMLPVSDPFLISCGQIPFSQLCQIPFSQLWTLEARCTAVLQMWPNFVAMKFYR